MAEPPISDIIQSWGFLSIFVVLFRATQSTPTKGALAPGRGPISISTTGAESENKRGAARETKSHFRDFSPKISCTVHGVSRGRDDPTRKFLERRTKREA